MFSNLSKSLRNNRGDILSSAIAGVLIFIAFAGAVTMFYNSYKSQQNSAEMEAAGDAAAKKLEELLSEPWSSPLLTAGEHDDGTPDVAFRWIVTDVPGKPRLKQIQVVKKHEHKTTRAVASKGILVAGYRYHDF